MEIIQPELVKIDPENVFLGYKVVLCKNGKLVSCVAPDLFSVEYQVNVWVSAKIPKSPLMVFGGLSNAIRFAKHTHSLIYECVYTVWNQYTDNRSERNEIIWIDGILLDLEHYPQNVLQMITVFWEDRQKYRTQYSGDLSTDAPYGTDYATHIKLLRRVDYEGL